MTAHAIPAHYTMRRRLKRGTRRGAVRVPRATFEAMQDSTPDPAPGLRAMVERRRTRNAA